MIENIKVTGFKPLTQRYGPKYEYLISCYDFSVKAALLLSQTECQNHGLSLDFRTSTSCWSLGKKLSVTSLVCSEPSKLLDQFFPGEISLVNFCSTILTVQGFVCLFGLFKIFRLTTNH